MTISFRILPSAPFNRIECAGHIYHEDELHEEIWLINKELRGAYLSKRERTKAQRQITQCKAMLDALRSAGA